MRTVALGVRPSRGFTIIELMVTVTVLAVLLALAAPSFAALLRQWRLSTTVETFAGDLRLARSTAIRTSRPVVLCVRNANQCGTGTDWTDGWLMFSDLNDNGNLNPGEPLIIQRGPQAGISSIKTTNTLGFRSNGTLNSAMAGINIEPIGAEASSPGMAINLTAMGRVSVVNMKPKANDAKKK